MRGTKYYIPFLMKTKSRNTKLNRLIANLVGK